MAAVEAPTKKQAKKKAALMAITNLARATESQSQEVSPRSAGTEESWQMLEDYEMVEAAIGGEVKALLSFNLQYFLNRMNGAGNLRFRLVSFVSKKVAGLGKGLLREVRGGKVQGQIPSKILGRRVPGGSDELPNDSCCQHTDLLLGISEFMFCGGVRIIDSFWLQWQCLFELVLLL